MIENLKELTGEIHDLTDQLNVILVHSQLLLMKDNLDTDTRAHAEEIIKAGERLAECIAKLFGLIDGDLSSTPPDASKILFPTKPELNLEKPHLRILVAEDNPANQSVLRMQLNALGFESHIAGDGSAALAQWQAGDYDLILADINMPGMDGLELTRFIRAAEQQNGKHIPIIALTAFHHQGDLNAYLKAGMDDVLPKPVDLDSLRLALHNWLPMPEPSKPALQPSVPQKPVPISYNDKVLDTSTLTRIIGNIDSKQVRDLVDLFIASAKSDLPICLQQLRQKDAVALALSMHKLKSSAQSVGALHFAEQAENLEHKARKGRLNEAAALLIELGHAITDVETALTKLFQSTEGVNGLKPALPHCVLVVDNDAVVLMPEAILEGLRNDEFKVYFQPKADIATLQPVGVEALARWWWQGNMISPETFIPVAEQHGLVGQLSEVLLTKALIGASCLAEAGFPLSVAVNLSANWLSDRQIPDFIQASVHATGLKVDKVILEITKTGATTDLTETLDILTRLHLKGFKLSVDDFGIGYSSLEQLQRIPFSEIKLDRTFIREAFAGNATARTILSSSMEMAAKLNLTTVAKGIETQEDFDLVKALGCDQVQGWFIAKPMRFNELIDWLRIWKPL